MPRTMSSKFDSSGSVARALDKRKWSLDVLRVVAIVGVVAIHVFGGMVSNSEIRGSGSWWVAVVIDIGFVWVVPVFVMISGSLLLAPREYEKGPGSFYRRRLGRLMPAMIFWSLFYFVVIRGMVTQASTTRVDVASFLLDGRPYTHLYFLWLIVGLYVVAPVVAAFLREGGEKRALIFAGVILAATVITASSSSLLGAVGAQRPLTLMALTQWVPYLGFFVAGWALRNLHVRSWKLLGYSIGTIIALAICVLQYGVRPAWWILDALAPMSYYGPVVAIAVIGVFVCGNSMLSTWHPGPRMAWIIRELSDSAFGVFLIHFAIMVGLREFAPFSQSAASLGVSAALWGIVVALSFVLVALIRRAPLLRKLV